MTDEMAKHALRAVLAAALLSWSGPAAAQDPGQRWTGTLTIYGWLPAVDGDVTASNSGDSASAFFDAADLLEDLDFAAFATGELRLGTRPRARATPRGRGFVRARAAQGRAGSRAGLGGFESRIGRPRADWESQRVAGFEHGR